MSRNNYNNEIDVFINEFLEKENITKEELLDLLEATGNTFVERGHYDLAGEYFEKFIAIGKELNRIEDVASGLSNLGKIAYVRKDLKKAESSYIEALRIYREIEDRQGEADTLGNIGLIYSDKGELDEALKYHKGALEIDREIGHKQGEASQLGNIGLIYRARGDLSEALEYLKDALKIHREIGHKQGEASDLGNIGLIYSDKGELDEALKYHKGALEIDREIGYKQGEASDLGNIGLIYRAKGELDGALTYLGGALQIHREIGYKQGEASQLGNIGLIYSDKGELDEALTYLEEALKIFTSTQSHPQVLQIYSILSSIFIENEPIKAFSYMKQALEYAPSEENAVRALFNLLSIVTYLVQQNQWEYLQHIGTVQSPQFKDFNSFFAAIGYYAQHKLSRKKEFLNKYHKKRKELDESLLEILDELLREELNSQIVR